MHAVIVTVRIDPSREQDAMDGLNTHVVPNAKASPGFVRGTWCGGDGAGFGLVLFDSREHAEAMAAQAGPPPGSGAQIESVRTLEVRAEA